MGSNAKKIGIGILAIGILLLFYGVFVEPYLIDVEEEVAVIPGLAPAWEEQRIAVTGDMQVGMWLANTSTVRRIVARLVEEQPATVLLLGDFVYHPVPDPDREVQKVIDMLRPLVESRIPVYAVLGNHDYAAPREQSAANEQVAQLVKTSLEAMGIKVLHNQAVPLEPPASGTGESSQPDSGLYVVGIGADYPDQARPDVALSGVPGQEPRVVMMHNPDTFGRLPPSSAPLAVAGHTHGGQIRIPFTPEWSWITFKSEDEVHADGWIDDYGAPGNRLYVNRGIGFSVVPIRINAPPEITMFTLRSE
ncbi:MAG TPA: metallophosphoesterase [Anaerolineae bacterium]